MGHIWVYRGRHWSFLTEELPELVGSLFRVSDRREDDARIQDVLAWLPLGTRA